jgi:hypothetical protein
LFDGDIVQFSCNRALNPRSYQHRSPTIAFPGAVKMFTLSVLDATGAVTRVVSFCPFVAPIFYSPRCQSDLHLPVLFGFRRRLLDQRRHFSRMRQHGQMISRQGN